MAMRDELFNEISVLYTFLKKIPNDKFCKNKAETWWMKIFKVNDSFPLLYKLVRIVFSLPISNAFVERVFSFVSAQWTDKAKRLHKKTVKSLLQIKVNLDHCCRQVHGVISKNKQLLEKIISGKKYGAK